MSFDNLAKQTVRLVVEEKANRVRKVHGKTGERIYEAQEQIINDQMFRVLKSLQNEIGEYRQSSNETLQRAQRNCDRQLSLSLVYFAAIFDPLLVGVIAGTTPCTRFTVHFVIYNMNRFEDIALEQEHLLLHDSFDLKY